MSSPRIACMALAIVGGFAACSTLAHGGMRSAEIQATQPTLSWQAYPSQRDIDKDIQGKLKSVKSVTYELVIYSGDRRIVYSRQFLPEPEHRLQVQLPPGQTFFWTVRAQFKIDGKNRVGNWSSSRWSNLLRWELPTPWSHYRLLHT